MNKSTSSVHPVSKSPHVGLSLEYAGHFSPERSHDSDDQESDESEGEDTDDDVYLAKHDSVLRKMREKWALMQQLKMETRKDTIPPASSNKKYENTKSPHRLQKTTHVMTNSTSKGSLKLIAKDIDDPGKSRGERLSRKRPFSSFSINNIGHALPSSQPQRNQSPINKEPHIAKKRGRPPKLQKLSHGKSNT